MTGLPDQPTIRPTEFSIGGDLPVRRLGFGTMQLTGPGHWGHPTDMDNAKAVLRRAVELGVNHFDTADAYGPEVAEHLIRKALHPYPDGLVIATKGGLTRQGPNRWAPVGRPAYLRQCVAMSLRRLALERIDLYYLHRIDPAVPYADQLGTLAELQQEGKIRHLGLSKVTVEQIEQGQQFARIAAIQNRCNLETGTDSVLTYCETLGIAYIPFAPLAAGKLAGATSGLGRLARAHETTPARLALAWLIHASAVTLPIPGTNSIAHLEDNLGADSAQLPAAALSAIARASRPSRPSSQTLSAQPM